MVKKLPGSEAADSRKFNRYARILPVTLDWKDENGTRIFAEGLTTDISAGGMFVHINPYPSAKTVVHFNVFLPAVHRMGPNVRIVGSGQIVRVQQLGGTGRWHGAAVRFSKQMIRVTGFQPPPGCAST